MIAVSAYCEGLSLSGSWNANAVNVSGNVYASSMTVSSLTVTNLLTIENNSTMKGVVSQSISVSTGTHSSSNTSLTVIPGLSIAIALRNASNYLRICSTSSFH